MAALKYVYEYVYRRRRVSEAPLEPVDSPEASYRILRPLLEGVENEQLIVLALNRKHRLIGYEVLYQGHLAGTPVRVAELFRFAIRVNAAAVVLAHNHPSEDPSPSADDIRTTRDALAAGRILGIDVLDHLVLAGERYVSLGETNSLRSRL